MPDDGPLIFALERVVVEPLPWPGNPARPLDTTNRGSQKFEVVDPDSGRVLYSRGYSTVAADEYYTARRQAPGIGDECAVP